MSPNTLLLSTLRYHWRTNLAVLLGVIAGTAVLGGALIVGDSVRGSLRDMTLARLGKVDHVLTGPRFVRETLAEELQSDPGFGKHFAAAAPSILTQASLEKTSPDELNTLTRAGKVNLYGLDDRLWSLLGHGETPAPADDEIHLSPNLARQLDVQPGDRILAAIELPSDLPRESLLGKRDKTSIQVPFTVKIVLNESSGVARFGLRPDQQLPYNAFVSLKTLQEQLGLSERRASRRDSRILPARVNVILVSARDESNASGAASQSASESLNKLLAQTWKLADLHLRLVPNEKFDYLSLESDRMILERPLATAAEETAQSLQLSASPALVSIANEMRVDREDETPADPEKPEFSRYSVVAGIPPSVFAKTTEPPFGPYEFVEGDATASLAGDEIIVDDWLAADLRAKVGDTVRLTYHIVGSHGELPEEERHFKIRGILKLDGTLAADRGITPEVPGITDVKSFDEWDKPFPMKRVTRRDDDYWSKYRATPKAFVTLSTAQDLWKNRYGNLTSFRIAPAKGQSLADAERTFLAAFREKLQLPEAGLAFEPVKYRDLQASSGSTDFGGLFIGFSLFLILSAVILIGLLFRLGIERRAANVGLLQAVGFTQKQVRRLLLREGQIVVLLGGLLGLAAAVSYAALMIHGLKTWWIGAIGTRFLELHVRPVSLVIGLLIACFVTLLALLGGLRGLRSVAIRSLLAGVNQPAVSEAGRAHRKGRSRIIAVGCALFAAAASAGVVSGIVPNVEAFSGFSWPTIAFFLVGMAMLTGGLATLSVWLDSDRAAAVRGSGFIGVSRLGVRNASRHRSRSLLTVGLIASATFLIVAIAAGHRNPAVEIPQKDSGNGGFTLVAESAVPLLKDLNKRAERNELALAPTPDPSGHSIDGVREIISFRVNPGENASCLNIYQTRQPTILGVPPEMIERGGFKFVGARESNPWTLLDQSDPDGTIPVFGDMNTLQYSLHVGPGSVLEIQGEDNQKQSVKIAGMFDGSVFQGVLLMSEANFLRLFPSRAGSQYFLIDVPPESATAVSDLLESQLPGFDAERVADRLAGFLAVQNTYLSTFQTLGGLGLLLGTIGLATVMLRNVLERRAELALLRAVGFRSRRLAWLILSENALLLGCGLATGTSSALVAMLPHLLSTGADLPWGETALILALVFTVGMLAALAAVRGAIRTPVVATLRAE